MVSPSPTAREEFVSSLENLFTISPDDIKAIVQDFHGEMRRGLSGHQSSLKMIPSFVDRPRGDEKGTFIALDLGGTNFRVLAVVLDGKGNESVPAVSTYAIPEKEMKGTGTELFDFIARCIDSFLTENAIDRKNVYNLAFTFSFPVAQTGIAAGTLIVWTKGFTATGVEGEDVVALLNDALRRRNICCINVTALANDTVGTLAARSYGDPTCDMGVILGTGTNGCYREKISNIPKLKGHDPDEYMIVNMEWGNFDKLRRTRYDKQVDESSLNPGAMFLEKMVSGMYLGELARLIIMDLIERGLLFLNESTAAGNFGEKDSLKTQYMSLIAGDATADLGETATFLNNKGITNTALRDRILLKRFCQIVSARSARLGAAAISAVVTWMDPGLNERHTVAVDGSLFEKYPGFEDEMKKVFKELFGGSAGRITLAHSKDGSGKGAAIIAAAAASKK